MPTAQDLAMRQSNDIQELVMQHLRVLGQNGFHWALLGGSTEFGDESLRLTMVLETRYAKAPVADETEETDQ